MHKNKIVLLTAGLLSSTSSWAKRLTGKIWERRSSKTASSKSKQKYWLPISRW